jgi:hypothetical protein
VFCDRRFTAVEEENLIFFFIIWVSKNFRPLNFFFSFNLQTFYKKEKKMLVLYETAAGYALFKLVDDNKLEKPEEIYKDFETSEKANQAYVFQKNLTRSKKKKKLFFWWQFISM